MRRRTATKAELPSERILVQDILNYVQQIIIEEQRAGRAIEDEYQAQLGAALNEDIPPLPFPEIPTQQPGAKKPGRVSDLAAQRRAANEKAEPGQIHIDEAIAAADKPSAASSSPAPGKEARRIAKIWKKKKIRRCRERVAALVKVRRYLEEMLAE